MPVRCLLNAHQMLKRKKTILPAKKKRYNISIMGIPIPNDDRLLDCPDCTWDMPETLQLTITDPYQSPYNWTAPAAQYYHYMWRLFHPETGQLYISISYCITHWHMAECYFYLFPYGYIFSPPDLGCRFYTFSDNRTVSVTW